MEVRLGDSMTRQNACLLTDCAGNGKSKNTLVAMQVKGILHDLRMGFRSLVLHWCLSGVVSFKLRNLSN